MLDSITNFLLHLLDFCSYCPTKVPDFPHVTVFKPVTLQSPNLYFRSLSSYELYVNAGRSIVGMPINGLNTFYALPLETQFELRSLSLQPFRELKCFYPGYINHTIDVLDELSNNISLVKYNANFNYMVKCIPSYKDPYYSYSNLFANSYAESINSRMLLDLITQTRSRALADIYAIHMANDIISAQSSTSKLDPVILHIKLLSDSRAHIHELLKF